jgi:NDP-sugar pyrophosphorylase family protein
VDAVLFAAGLGTRLAPLTDRLPKALVTVGGVPLLERNARRLAAAGADRLVVIVHRFPEQFEAWARDARDLPAEVVFSREVDRPLETGGGLWAARDLLRRDAPFFLHNADVWTDLPLADLHAAHLASGALVTLAVMERPTSRRLLFDARGLLGRVDAALGLRRVVREAEGPVLELGFSGVHVASPGLLGRIEERGVFSILDPYLRLAGAGERILPFRVDGCAWIDVGRPADLERARREAAPAAEGR